jgi:hypothetical protein
MYISRFTECNRNLTIKVLLFIPFHNEIMLISVYVLLS